MKEIKEMLSTSEARLRSMHKGWNIPWEEIRLDHELGRGAFGIVSKGLWRDMTVAVKSGEDQDIKMLLGLTDDMMLEMNTLQSVRHPNIVLFFGGGRKPDGATFIVLEFVELGTLTGYLELNPAIPWSLKLSFCHDAAKGMAHLHSLNRMHRDLKSPNLLVSASKCLKVADFGTAAITGLSAAKKLTELVCLPYNTQTIDMDDSQEPNLHTTRVGTVLWMAPEILEHVMKNSGPKLIPYDCSVDLYSFGIVMWEIASQRLPWLGVTKNLLQMILNGERPFVDTAAWTPAYCALLQRCWATSPKDRPSFAEVCLALKLQISDQLCTTSL